MSSLIGPPTSPKATGRLNSSISHSRRACIACCFPAACRWTCHSPRVRLSGHLDRSSSSCSEARQKDRRPRPRLQPICSVSPRTTPFALESRSSEAACGRRSTGSAACATMLSHLRAACEALPAEGRGFDDLPPELLGRFNAAIVRSLDRDELLRALGGTVDGLLEVAGDDDPRAAAIAAQLRVVAPRE